MTSLQDPAALREEIAAVAARLIAEDGLDYAGAKKRALREVVGSDARHRDCLPDNAQVEEAVREHQGLFLADTQPMRLLQLRTIARDAMRFLTGSNASLSIYAVGAIVNGTAGEHSDVHLLVHDDNAKDIEIFLVNAGIDYDALEVPGGETLSFLWPPHAPHRFSGTRDAIHLTIVDPRFHRGASPGGARADINALEALICAQQPAASSGAAS